ncbi:hypothetical protein BD626DRAFT_566231 [Schizophyllum amplum]|uniref:Uncharacterized protein n=1 Tax=Schizophyllum amplum TaxID=97359 RepID=A0A550CQX7_9AGAR|nr:hypothetical protein BD626DRAFT_566231 [Auriculariopsis ampla]
MFSTPLCLLTALAALATASPLQRRTGGPAINSPAANSVIMPGQDFDFSYQNMGDYGRSSYNLTVWLFSSELGAFTSGSDTVATGHYFGRFPLKNGAVPTTLTMPDLSVNPGDFGEGQSASNATMYIAVFEEWADWDGSLGEKVAFASTPIIYNGTST